MNQTPKYKPLDFAQQSQQLPPSSQTSVSIQFSAWWQSYAITMALVLFGFFVLGTIVWVKWNTTGQDITLTERTIDYLTQLLESIISFFETGLQEAYNKLYSINASISSDINLIEDAINETNAESQTLIIEITGRIAFLQELLDTKLSRLQTVLPDTLTSNVDLLVGAGLLVTTGNVPHTLHIINTGVVDITSPDGSIDVNITDGVAVLQHNGICTVTSVASDSTTGNLNIVGAGMLLVTTNVNTSTITVDGSVLYEALVNVNDEVSGHAVEIAELLNTTAQLQQQINTLLAIGEMSEESFNGTLSSVNMTFIELVMAIVTLENQMTVLENKVAELSVQSNETVGVIMAWSGNENSTAPTGWIICDGTNYNASDYAELYARIGQQFCTTPCASGVFAVPDLRGTIPAARGTGASVLNVAVGTQVGQETVALATLSTPAHQHTGLTYVGQGQHAHITNEIIGSGNTAYGTSPDYSFSPTGLFASNDFANGGTAHIQLFNTAFDQGSYYGASNYGLHGHDFLTSLSGSNTPHNNVQPSVIMHYIIKT